MEISARVKVTHLMLVPHCTCMTLSYTCILHFYGVAVFTLSRLVGGVLSSGDDGGGDADAALADGDDNPSTPPDRLIGRSRAALTAANDGALASEHDAALASGGLAPLPPSQ